MREELIWDETENGFIDRRRRPRPTGLPIWTDSSRSIVRHLPDRGEVGYAEEEIADEIVIPAKPPPRLKAVVISTLLLLVLGLLADATYVAFEMRASLVLAADYLAEARSSLGRGEVGTAQRQASAALEVTGTAQDAIGRPSFALGTYVPAIRNDLRAVAALTRASQSAARAALAATSAAAEIGLGPEGALPAVFEGGRVDVDALERAHPHVLAAESELTDAVDTLGAVGPVRIGTLREGLADAGKWIDQALESARTARLTFASLPGLLGAEGAREYVLAFQALGEARGTGGVIGTIGALSATEGRLELASVDPTLAIFPRPLREVTAPVWFRAAYERQAATTQIQQANVSPHLPVVAEVVLEMYRQATDRVLDGVIFMDAVTLEQLLDATGPITSSHLPDATLDGSSAAEVILKRSYEELTNDAQNLFIADVVEQFWGRVVAGDIDVEALVAGVEEATRSGHMKIYSTDPITQGPLVALGGAGSYPSGIGNMQLVFHNNYGVNKVDYFMHRRIEMDIRLASDGSAEFTTTVTLNNEAPDGPPSLLLGTGPSGRLGVRPGLNRMQLAFLMPRGASDPTLLVDGNARVPDRWDDEFHPVAATTLDIAPSSSRTVELSYVVPAAFSLLDGKGRFELALLPHTTANEDTYFTQVTAPPGYAIVDSSDLSLQDGRATAQGVLDQAVFLSIGLTNSSATVDD